MCIRDRYDTSVTIPESYTESSTILNVDIASLALDAIGDYSGFITKDMVLTGKTSNAIARVSNVKLISDAFGALYGSFFFRDPLTTPPPPLVFTNGTKTFRLTSDPNNANPLPGDENTNAGITRGDAEYSTSGIINDITLVTTIVERPPAQAAHCDPLAQSFTVDETGAFLSSFDLYFADKDDNIPITIQLRTVELGTPTDQLVYSYAQVVLDPTEVDSSGESIIKLSLIHI